MEVLVVDGGGNRARSHADVPATWRSLFAVREYRALWTAQFLSLCGDQLARVAIAVLVFEETGSALVTGVVYAISYVPWLIGGPLLGGLGDRFPRRTVMVACDLISAGLVLLLAIPGSPLAVLCAILFLVVLMESPFQSARAALMVDILPDDRYVLASAVNNLTIQAAQVLGFAAGGLMVAVIGSRSALLIDSASFLLSAIVVRLFIRDRRPSTASTDPAAQLGWWRRMTSSARLLFSDPRLRGLVLLAWLATFWVIPEGLAAPYADDLGGAAATVGLILAAQPAGAVIGNLIISRLIRPVRRLELMGPLAVLAGLPLIACATRPGLVVTLALLFVSGLGTSYNVPANAAFMQTVPARSRGQAFGLVSAGLVAGQGLGIAIGGALAELLDPPIVVALAGIVGTLAAVTVSASIRKYVAQMSPVLR